MCRGSILNLPPPPQGDVCNPRLVNHIFNTERIDAIFHLAAKTHVGEWQLNRDDVWPLLLLQGWFHFLFSSPPESSFRFPSSFQRVNVDGTRVLLEAAHQARHQPRRFIYVSTDEVYGASVDQVGQQRGFIPQAGGPQSFDLRAVFTAQIFDESSPLRPSNPYSVTKAAAELLVTSYWDAYKVDLTQPCRDPIWPGSSGLTPHLPYPFCTCAGSFPSSSPGVTTFMDHGSTPRRFVLL